MTTPTNEPGQFPLEKNNPDRVRFQRGKKVSAKTKGRRRSTHRRRR